MAKTASTNSLSKSKAAARLRSRYHSSEDRYSRFASGWKRTGLLTIQERCALAPDLIPRNGFHPSVFDVLEPAGDFLLPGEFGVRIDGRVQTVDQAGCQLGTVFFREAQRVLQQFVCFHRSIIAPVGKGAGFVISYLISLVLVLPGMPRNF